MKIVVNDIETEWSSSFLQEMNDTKQQKWKKKREDYFTEGLIIGKKVFIKRINSTLPDSSFLHEIKNKRLINIPKLYDVVSTNENHKDVNYTFYEFIEGKVLDQYSVEKKFISFSKFTKSLLRSLKSIHEQGYWHTDINCENIIVNKNEKAFIIDIDSCQKFEIVPTHVSNIAGSITTRSNQLAANILKYYKTYLNREDVSFSTLNGKSLNLLQVLFLVQKVKYVTNKDHKVTVWKKSTFKSVDLIKDLRALDPFMIDDLFLGALDNSIEVEKLTQVFKLIDEKLYNENLITEKQEILVTNPYIQELNQEADQALHPDSSLIETHKTSSKHKKGIILIIGSVIVLALAGFLFSKSKSDRTDNSIVTAVNKKATTLNQFFDYINDNNDKAAYNITSNPKWQPLSKFSSTVGWGGFDNIILVESENEGNNLLTYYSADNIQEEIKIHRLSSFEFDDQNKINKLKYFPKEIRNSLTTNAALETVNEFFRYIAKLDFQRAHYFTSNPIWGDVDFFSSSVTGWGGLSKFKVIETRHINNQCHKDHELVYVKYYEEDPTNDNYGTREMYYHLGLKQQEYKIVRATLTQNGD